MSGRVRSSFHFKIQYCLDSLSKYRDEALSLKKDARTFLNHIICQNADWFIFRQVDLLLPWFFYHVSGLCQNSNNQIAGSRFIVGNERLTRAWFKVTGSDESCDRPRGHIK